jgi:hypothetical protein
MENGKQERLLPLVRQLGEGQRKELKEKMERVIRRKKIKQTNVLYRIRKL